MDKVKAQKLLKKFRGYFNDMEWYRNAVFKEVEAEKNIEKVMQKLEKKNIYPPRISDDLVAKLIEFLEESIAEEP